MNEAHPTASRLLVGHLLVAWGVASILSAISAFLLRPLYHGHFDGGGANDTVGWVIYFEFGFFTVGRGAMLGTFVLVFVLVPLLLSLWLSRHNPEPQFTRWYAIAGFAALLVIGLALNLLIGFHYSLAGFNSTDPF